MSRSTVRYAELKVQGNLIGRTKEVKVPRNPYWGESFDILVDISNYFTMSVIDALDEGEGINWKGWLGSASIRVEEIAASISADYGSVHYGAMDSKFESMLNLALNKLICLVSH